MLNWIFIFIADNCGFMSNCELLKSHPKAIFTFGTWPIETEPFLRNLKWKNTFKLIFLPSLSKDFKFYLNCAEVWNPVFLQKFCVAIFSGWRQQLQNKQDFLFFNPYLKLHNFIFQSRVFHFHRQDLSVIPPILKSSNFEILELEMRKKYFREIKEVWHWFYIFYWALKVH